jgi:hypothetical protein
MPIRSTLLRQVGPALLVALGGCARSAGVAPASPARAAGPEVVLDGDFTEWSGTPIVARRDAPVTAAGADPLAVRARSDGRFVYLEIDFARPINLFGLSGTFSIDVNSDGDDATGATIDGLAGTDFTVDLSPTNANGRVGEGAAVRSVGRTGTIKVVDSYGLDFVMQPSHESQHVELRLGRARLLGDSTAARTFSAATYRAQVVAHDANGRVTSRLPAFTASLAPLDPAQGVIAAQPHDPLARAPGTQFRALVWNVANEGILERPERFRHVLDAIDPDLIVFNETAGKAGRERVGAFLATIGRGRGTWNYTYGGGGGYQRTVIASRAAVTELPEFRFIPFTEAMTTPWLSLVPPERVQRERDSLHIGLATGAAIVSIAGRRVAVVGVDLQSAGNRRGSWQDVRRISEAQAIRDLATAAIKAHGPVDAIIQAGDHNLVGTREPLTILQQIGVPFDGQPLTAAKLLQLDGATAVTWDGSGGQFPPGHLDWFNYTASRLEVLGGFVFDALDLDPRWQQVHGVTADDSRYSSDHRPLVVDLRFKAHDAEH